MDACLTQPSADPTGRARVPTGLPPARAWRWCVLTTVRRAQRARRRGRPISAPNLERLFMRQWTRVAPHCWPALDRWTYRAWAARGRRLATRGQWARRMARPDEPSPSMPA